MDARRGARDELSETAFVARRDDGDWSLRWFTPGAEVDLVRPRNACQRPFPVEPRPDEPRRVGAFPHRSGLLTCRAERRVDRHGLSSLADRGSDRNRRAAPGAGRPPTRVWHSTWDILAEFATRQEAGPQAGFPALLPFAERGVLVTAPGTAPMISSRGFLRRCTGLMKTRDGSRTASSPPFGATASANPHAGATRRHGAAAS